MDKGYSIGNQHKLIKGYRDLSHEEIDLMNEGEELASSVGEWIDKLQKSTVNVNGANIYIADKRWLEIGKTDLQKGFMATIRSIARPTSF